MEAQMMINTIATRLNSMGIGFQTDNTAEVTIQTEFLDAAWGSGNKKIEYQVSAFLNEAERTLYFWEFTKETSSGISVGSDSASSFQSGMTVYRKVKSVGYGPDGKAYEYNLDLGAIVKVFKETAKQQGWKFKVVLKREKAQQVDESRRILDTQQAGSTVSQKGKKLWWGLVVLLGLITIIFFGSSGTSVAGWLVAAVIIALLFFVQRKMPKKGCLFGLLLWVVALVLIFVTFAVTTTFSPTKTAQSTVKPLLLTNQQGKAVEGKFQIALQNMVYSYVAAEFLTAEVLQVDVTLVAKADWEAKYNKTLQAWQRVQQYAQVLDQLVAQMPVQVSVLPETQRIYRQSDNQTLVSRGSLEVGGLVNTWLTVLEPRPVYALGEEGEVELNKNLSISTDTYVLMAYNGLPPGGGDKIKTISRVLNVSSQEIYKILNENFTSEAKLYGYKDSFYNAASKTAQAIETAADVGLFVGDIMTGGGGKFSIAKSGVKNFAKTALITSVTGADMLLEVTESSVNIGLVSTETGAYISSARNRLNPLTTLFSLKSIGEEGLKAAGNIKTIVGWGLLVADKASTNANVYKVEDNQGHTEVRAFNNPKLTDKLMNENEVALQSEQKKIILQAIEKRLITLSLDKKVKEEPSISKPSTESASKPNLEPTLSTPIVTPTPKSTPPPTPTPTPAPTPAPNPTTPIPPAQEYDYKAALAAWVSDFAAEVNGRVYPSDGVSNRSNEFEWVRSPFIKDDQVLGASKIWQNIVYYAGDYAGRTIRSTTNEWGTADNPLSYISVGELRKKYPQFEH